MRLLARKAQNGGDVMADAEPTEATEITLSTGRLLGMFFALVAICAVFFALGYSLGRGSGGSVSGATEPPPPPSATASGAAKPSAIKGTEPKPDANTADELTFYKSVEQKDANPQLAAKPPDQPAQPAPATPAAAPEIAKPAPGGYVVQIAAVTKQEDAEALVSNLRKKQYPVFINSGETDKLFHIQVGPFNDIKDAEAMRAKLAGDGYSPIVKR